MNIQRKIAANILKCGKDRIWIDPRRMEEISQAITRRDVRALIKNGLIKKIPEKGTSRGRKKKIAMQKKKGRRKGYGRRKGSSIKKKDVWMKRIRALRNYARQLKEKGMISTPVYRSIYNKSGAGFFKSKNHMKIYLEKEGLLKSGK